MPEWMMSTWQRQQLGPKGGEENYFWVAVWILVGADEPKFIDIRF